MIKRGDKNISFDVVKLLYERQLNYNLNARWYQRSHFICMECIAFQRPFNFWWTRPPTWTEMLPNFNPIWMAIVCVVCRLSSEQKGITLGWGHMKFFFPNFHYFLFSDFLARSPLLCCQKNRYWYRNFMEIAAVLLPKPSVSVTHWEILTAREVENSI